MAKNVVIDGWRAEQRRPRLVDDDETLATQPVEDELDARVDAWMVQQALERLSFEHRTVVDHLYYGGAPIAGKDVDTTLTVAVIADLDHNGIYDDAPNVVTDQNGDGRINRRDLKAIGVASNVETVEFHIDGDPA